MAIQICSNCGYSNEKSASVCIVCSHSLKDASLQGTPEEDKQYNGILAVKQVELTCSECNGNVEQGSTECKNCGSMISNQIASEKSDDRPTEEQASERNIGCTTLLIVIIATAIYPIVGILVGGVYAFNNDKEKRGVGIALLVLGLLLKLGYWVMR